MGQTNAPVHNQQPQNQPALQQQVQELVQEQEPVQDHQAESTLPRFLNHISTRSSRYSLETVSQHYIRLENDLFYGKNDTFYQRLNMLIVHDNAYLHKNHTSMTGLLLVEVAAVLVPGTLVAAAGIVAEAAVDMNGCILILKC